MNVQVYLAILQSMFSRLTERKQDSSLIAWVSILSKTQRCGSESSQHNQLCTTQNKYLYTDCSEL